MSERDEDRHVATGDAAPSAPTVRDPAPDRDRPVAVPAPGPGEEVPDPAGDADADVLQAVVDFIDDLVESDEPGGGGRANGGGGQEVSPEAPRT